MLRGAAARCRRSLIARPRPRSGIGVTAIPANSGLHIIPIPYSKKFVDLYALSEFTSADYPNLVPPGEHVDTIAVPSVLAVYNWPKNSDRYRVGGYFKQTPCFAGPKVIPELAAELLATGWSPEELRGFLGENWLRVMEKVW